jgi:hypothetical protein
MASAARCPVPLSEQAQRSQSVISRGGLGRLRPYILPLPVTTFTVATEDAEKIFTTEGQRGRAVADSGCRLDNRYICLRRTDGMNGVATNSTRRDAILGVCDRPAPTPKCSLSLCISVPLPLCRPAGGYTGADALIRPYKLKHSVPSVPALKVTKPSPPAPLPSPQTAGRGEPEYFRAWVCPQFIVTLWLNPLFMPGCVRNSSSLCGEGFTARSAGAD